MISEGVLPGTTWLSGSFKMIGEVTTAVGGLTMVRKCEDAELDQGLKFPVMVAVPDRPSR